MEKIDERKKLEFEKALELRNFEIDNFWKRGWFFGALLIALFGGYFEFSKKEYHDELNIKIYIAFIAFLVSLAQCLMNRGSKYWQERYEYFVKNRESSIGVDVTKMRGYPDKNDPKKRFERNYIDISIRAKAENSLVRSARFSVSKITILVWDIIAGFTLFTWIHEIFLSTDLRIKGWICGMRIMVNTSAEVDWWLILFHLCIILYVILFFYHGRVFEALSKSVDREENKRKTKYDNDMTKYVDDKIS